MIAQQRRLRACQREQGERRDGEADAYDARTSARQKDDYDAGDERRRPDPSRCLDQRTRYREQNGNRRVPPVTAPVGSSSICPLSPYMRGITYPPCPSNAPPARMLSISGVT